MNRFVGTGGPWIKFTKGGITGQCLGKVVMEFEEKLFIWGSKIHVPSPSITLGFICKICQGGQKVNSFRARGRWISRINYSSGVLRFPAPSPSIKPWGSFVKFARGAIGLKVRW